MHSEIIRPVKRGNSRYSSHVIEGTSKKGVEKRLTNDLRVVVSNIVALLKKKNSLSSHVLESRFARYIFAVEEMRTLNSGVSGSYSVVSVVVVVVVSSVVPSLDPARPFPSLPLSLSLFLYLSTSLSRTKAVIDDIRLRIAATQFVDDAS